MKVLLNTVRVLLDLHEVDLVALVVRAQLLPLSVSAVKGHGVHDPIEQGIVPGLIVHGERPFYDRVRV